MSSIKAIGKTAYCSLGHIVVVCGEDGHSSAKCMIIKQNDRYPINRVAGEMTSIAAPYIELTKKDLLLLHDKNISCEKLRKRFKIAELLEQS